MKIIGRSMLDNFKQQHVDIRSQIDAWVAEANDACWKTPSDIKQRYASASVIADNHVIFNLKGNKYRLLVQVNYKNQIVLIKKIGTHNEYIKW